MLSSRLFEGHVLSTVKRFLGISSGIPLNTGLHFWKMKKKGFELMTSIKCNRMVEIVLSSA